ncbi:hypothetical protein Tsubulata_041671 [Turnera subulata]|uniref:Uncharacterized protein n=1 Tax=Turnera subulata TaxID=218843 RepID=A0A9Q0F7M9_9ROSI|nr:hypothetical protein Tsubulata_041671 [Turnera subulata]
MLALLRSGMLEFKHTSPDDASDSGEATSLFIDRVRPPTKSKCSSMFLFSFPDEPQSEHTTFPFGNSACMVALENQPYESIHCGKSSPQPREIRGGGGGGGGRRGGEGGTVREGARGDGVSVDGDLRSVVSFFQCLQCRSEIGVEIGTRRPLWKNMAPKMVIKTLERGTAAKVTCSLCKQENFTQASLGQHKVDAHQSGNGLLVRLEELRVAQQNEIATNVPPLSKNQKKRLEKKAMKKAAEERKERRRLQKLGLDTGKYF